MVLVCMYNIVFLNAFSSLSGTILSNTPQSNSLATGSLGKGNTQSGNVFQLTFKIFKTSALIGAKHVGVTCCS